MKDAKPRKPLARIGKKKLAALGGQTPRSSLATRKPMARENTATRSKRRTRNAEYYKSPEWRAKKKAVHERDGYRCTERLFVPSDSQAWHYPDAFDARRARDGSWSIRCMNTGEIVNGKQTARGLVCEETSYGHRGVPDRIDTCRTRCKDCDRRQTPLERVNHAQGFRR